MRYFKGTSFIMKNEFLTKIKKLNLSTNIV